MGNRCTLTRKEDGIHVEKPGPVSSVAESGRVFPLPCAKDGIRVKVARQVEGSCRGMLCAGGEVGIDESEGAVIHCDRSREAALNKNCQHLFLFERSGRVRLTLFPYISSKPVLKEAKSIASIE